MFDPNNPWYTIPSFLVLVILHCKDRGLTRSQYLTLLVVSFLPVVNAVYLGAYAIIRINIFYKDQEK